MSSGDLELVSPLVNLGAGARARLSSDDDDLAGLLASGESGSESSSLRLKSVDSDGSLVNLDLLGGRLASAASSLNNNDGLSGLLADLDDASELSESSGDSLSSLNSDLSELDSVTSNLVLPSSDVGSRA